MEQIEYIVASDVNDRDGISLEVWKDGILILEIFRDDTKKTREITNYEQGISIQLVEDSIQVFKDKGLWEFVK